MTNFKRIGKCIGSPGRRSEVPYIYMKMEGDDVQQVFLVLPGHLVDLIEETFGLNIDVLVDVEDRAIAVTKGDSRKITKSTGKQGKIAITTARDELVAMVGKHARTPLKQDVFENAVLLTA